MIYQAPEMQHMQTEQPKPLKRPRNAIKYPHALFDYIKARHELKSDTALSYLIAVSSPELSRIRKGVSPITSRMILSIYDGTGMTIEEIRELL